MGSFKNQNIILFIFVLIASFLPYYAYSRKIFPFDNPIIYAASMLTSIVVIIGFMIFLNLNKRMGSQNQVAVPKMLIDNADTKKAFLRGLADTDFSLVFKNRHKNVNYYPVIDFQTSNKVLCDSLVSLLEFMGFDIYSNQRMKKRKDTAYQSYYFQINGIKAFKKWMGEIGFTNDNQLTKVRVWKKFGFLPPNTTINDRMAILKGEKDIYLINK